MVHKRLLGLATVAILAAACSSSATPTPAPTLAATPAPVASTAPSSPSVAASPTAHPNWYIPIISKGWNAQYWVAVRQGAQAEATKEGVTINFLGPDNESQVDVQLSMLQQELAKKPDALCFAALDGKADQPVLQKYSDAKIPVIGFDSGVAPFVPVTTVATDNSKAGAVAADKIGDAIGGSGKVGLIVQDQVAESATSRRDGFLAEIKAKYPNITIVGPQYSNGGDIQTAANIAKSMITANPDLKAIFGTNEGSAEGAVQGVKEAGKGGGKVLVGGYDSGKAQIDAINAGDEMGAITQNPVGIGTQCVIAAVKAIEGISQPANVDTGFYWYDNTNITDPNIVADLYQ
jgi:ribose transport system substrate-binding protein